MLFNSVRTFQILVITALLVWTPCFCQNKKKSDLIKDKLDGRVKQLKQNIYAAKEIEGKLIPQGKIVTDSLSNYLKTYNAAGNLTELIDYNAGNNKFFKHIYIYDDKGNRLEESF